MLYFHVVLLKVVQYTLHCKSGVKPKFVTIPFVYYAVQGGSNF